MATLELTTENFNETLTGNDVVLVDFWAEWCGPCQQFGPVYERVSEKHPDIVFGKVDTEAQQMIAREFGISSIPTLMAVRERTVLYQEAGALNEESLEDLIRQIRELDMEQVRAEIAKQQSSDDAS
ncbi:thioredoxin [Lipingzhangella sp. LS1_29]|uniref:Thioredoxin n=1 Tax=Lipingzhangella rawalii TaxID=2055835 RepID=A0ABU2H415_9ACTN|nr:thioredoxin [Lipingzhangella rawalii]MDS1270052.1 thioredoxin [Lipingzhangella rawalii]